ncbi:glycosyl hydrolase [Pseudoduganella aquatica]|uniref:Glycosyl hydrolase n=1 Tax=Pseudoduganella aquatica TaxID=2660641 RepID=A0A7X4HDA0_9BURK|nr:glycosyl hydrolase [Pseudoduganella aquatica]MYN08120.1 glycosyl hydrolase [Pseudoduganella aquatica]
MHFLIKTALLACAVLGSAQAASPSPRVVYSPYKHLAMHNDPASNVITVAPDGKRVPYLGHSKQTLTWAFASGECGEENWGGQPAQAVADANVPAFAAAGVGYIISTGGQGNVFTCGSDEGMERFIKRYESPQLIGIDFDIEAGQTREQVDSLVRRIAAAQARRPQLRFSFTVATHAASDGSRRSLNEMAETVLDAVRRSGLKDYALNIMVMDYGPAAKNVCVVRKGRCDMGASALQAARNVHEKYKLPYSQIELTAMIGVNDVVENVFTMADMDAMARGARKLKLAGLHFWSVDRDTPCRSEVKGADAACSGMPGVPPGAYARALEAGK